MNIVGRAFLVVLCTATTWATHSSVALPELDRSVAATALGEGAAGLSGIDAVGTDPSGLIDAPREAAFGYRSFPLDTSVGRAALAIPIRLLSATVGAHVASLKTSHLDKRDGAGVKSGEFGQEEDLVGLHVALPLSTRFGRVGIGASAKYYRSRIEKYSASAIGADLGVRWQTRGLPLRVSIAATNIGQGPKLLNERSSWPTSFGVSADYCLGHGVNLVAGARTRPGDRVTAESFGARAAVGKNLSVQGSYTAATGQEGRQGWGQVAVGATVKIGPLRLEYTFVPAGDDFSDAGLGATQQASVGVTF